MGKANLQLVFSHYDPCSGISMATIRTKKGLFTGIAKLNPDDKDCGSRFAGCQYAETRARIKYYKEMRKEAVIKRKAMKDLYFSIYEAKDFRESSFESRKIKRAFSQYNFEVERWDKIIHDEEEGIRKSVETREVALKKIAKRAKPDNK